MTDEQTRARVARAIEQENARSQMPVVHTFTVTVQCTTREQADLVMTERLLHDEDYGFDYSIDWADALQYEVGDTITYSTYDFTQRTVIVTERHEDVKNGRPGFSAVWPTIAEDIPVWGYDDQIDRVERKA